MKTHEIRYMVVASLSDGSAQQFGERTDLPEKDIIDQYFGNRGLIDLLAQSMETRLMPRMVSQGEALCVILRPARDVVVGAFIVTSESATEQYHRSIVLDRELNVLWRSASRRDGADGEASAELGH